MIQPLPLAAEMLDGERLKASDLAFNRSRICVGHGQAAYLAEVRRFDLDGCAAMTR